MDSDKNSEDRLRDLKMATVIASTAILGFFVIYWSLQIQEVRAMLELAYG